MLTKIGLFLGIFALSALAQNTFTFTQPSSPWVLGQDSGFGRLVINPTNPLTTPIQVTMSITSGPFVFPQSTASDGKILVFVYNPGDTQKTFYMRAIPDISFVPPATPPACSLSIVDGSGQLTAITPSFTPSVTLRALELISPYGGLSLSLRPGETSRPFTVRIQNDLPYEGESTTLSLNLNPGSLIASPSPVVFAVGQTAATFTLTAPTTGWNSATIVPTVTIAASANQYYTFSGASIIVSVQLGSLVDAVHPFAGARLPLALDTAPWYVFLTMPFPADVTAGALMNVGGGDAIIRTNRNPPAFDFLDGGALVSWQRFWLNGTGLTSAGQSFINVWPTSTFNASIQASYPSIWPATTIGYTVVSRSWSVFVSGPANSPIGPFVYGETFVASAQFFQPLPTGSWLEVFIDAPGVVFYNPANGRWETTVKARVGSSASGTAVSFRGRVAQKGPASVQVTFSIDGPAFYLYGGASQQEISINLNSNPVMTVTNAPSHIFLGEESSPYRVSLSHPPLTGVSVIPMHPYCTAKPLVLPFSPSGSLHQRFTLTCNPGYPLSPSGVESQVIFRVAGRDAAPLGTIGAPGAISTGGAPRAPVLVFPPFSNTGSGGSCGVTAVRGTGQIYIGEPFKISFYTNRAPDSSITLQLTSTGSVALSATSVTLTKDAPGATITLTPLTVGSGVFSWAISGPDAWAYSSAGGNQAWTSVPRVLRVDRVCSAGELTSMDVYNPSCSLLGCQTINNYTLNAPDRFPTFFNFTVVDGIPATAGLTIIPRNGNLKFNPAQVRLNAGETSAQFSVSTAVAGTHKISFTFVTDSADAYYHDVPADIDVVQNVAGAAAVDFPASSATQATLSIFLLVAALLAALL